MELIKSVIDTASERVISWVKHCAVRLGFCCNWCYMAITIVFGDEPAFVPKTFLCWPKKGHKCSTKSISIFSDETSFHNLQGTVRNQALNLNSSSVDEHIIDFYIWCPVDISFPYVTSVFYWFVCGMRLTNDLVDIEWELSVPWYHIFCDWCNATRSEKTLSKVHMNNDCVSVDVSRFEATFSFFALCLLDWYRDTRSKYFNFLRRFKPLCFFLYLKS